MCMACYIASDFQLPRTKAWSEENPGFYVTDLQPDEMERIRDTVTLPFVRYVGAFTGCSCGYRSFSEGATEPTTEDAAAAQSDHEAFAHYLEGLPAGSSIQLLVCWEGDESKPPRYRRALRPSDIASLQFGFYERERSTVTV
jgi:hypothetical protein